MNIYVNHAQVTWGLFKIKTIEYMEKKEELKLKKEILELEIKKLGLEMELEKLKHEEYWFPRITVGDYVPRPLETFS